ncbi:MAG: hypothetical protein ABSB42_03990 [Tepidisphaeraceae bacterium]|jgi:hypothetical protein
MESKTRPLTDDEARILRLLRNLYGPQNDVDSVFFTNQDQAAILVRDKNGVDGILVVLTNVALTQKTEGMSDEEVSKKCLLPPFAIAVNKIQPN